MIALAPRRRAHSLPFSSLAAALFVSLTSSSATPSRLHAQQVVRPADGYETAAEVLAQFIEHERTQKGIPAISIALVRGQRVVWARGFGWEDSVAAAPATASTVYRVGSVSKLFTDIGIMKLVERGELDLDAPVRRYLPDFHPRNPFGGEITLRQLTSHRAGLTREPPVGHYFDDTAPSLAATVASLNGTTLVYAPGARTKYSNAGVAVLGYVLEKTRHESFYSYLERAVLDSMGLGHSAFRPRKDILPHLAGARMWTLDGRTFDAPTFQLGMGPCGSMYSTVLDLGRFLGILFAGGTTPEGRRVLARATLDPMWTPQFAPRGATSGFGIGFNLGRFDGHRTFGHGGAIYGFATALLGLPDDSIGIVVAATLDGANAVTDRVARAAARLMLDVAAGREPVIRAEDDTTTALPAGRALALMGRYAGTRPGSGVELSEYEGRLFLTPLRGGSRAELRVPAPDRSGVMAAGRAAGAPVSAGAELVADDVLAFGLRVKTLDGGRIVVGADTLVRQPTPGAEQVPMAAPKPSPASTELASLVGEYGWDHNVLYLREKDGRLNALIEWFFEYPLERVSRDVYRFPDWGLYQGQEIVFRRGRNGRPTTAVAATVPFVRRALPGDDDRVNFRIAPVKPVAELRRAALAATPPRETRDFLRPDLVELRTLDSTIHYDIRYATSNNFMGTPFYTSAHAFMQRPAAEAVVRASARLRSLGFGLLIHDAYRPWYVTKMFWDGTPQDKHVFVADPAQGSRHNRGCAVDLTLYDLRTGAPIRMTGGYDELTDRSYPLYSGGTGSQRWHRDLLRHALEAEGFTVYDAEWWHFDFADWRRYPIGTLTFEQLAAGQAAPEPGRVN